MKEKLLELYGRIKEGVVNLFKRFPITSAYIVLQYISLSLAVEWNYFNIHPKQLFFLLLIVGTSYALVFHSIIIQLLSERFDWSMKKKMLLNLGSILLTSVIFILFTYRDFVAFDSIAGNFTGNMYRLIVYIGLSGILTIFVPFLKDKDNKTWWNFTMYSASKAAVSMLYAIVLYAGIAIALEALQEFWGITLFTNQFELLPIFTFVLFAQLNFLSDVFNFNTKVKFTLPKFLSIFGKFILTPLIVIYTAILYPYMFSFPFKEMWPSNQSTFIILAMISMIYAVMYIFWNTKEGDSDYKFVNWFTRITNAVAIPTVLFWAYSMWVRIDAYKLTVNRFVVMAVIVWFLLNSVYFVIAKSRDIRLVLGAFLSIVVLSFYMPFSAFYFGQRAQEKRLVTIADREGILVEGKIVIGDKEKTSNSDQEMKDVIVYLNGLHSLKNVKGMVSDELLKKLAIDQYDYSKLFVNDYSYFESLFFKTLLPVSQGSVNGNTYVNVLLDETKVTIPKGYTKVHVIDGYDFSKTTYNKTVVTYNGMAYDVNVDLNSEKFITKTSSPIMKDPYGGPNTLYTSDPTLLTFKSGDTVLVVTNLSANIKEKKIVEVTSIYGVVFSK